MQELNQNIEPGTLSEPSKTNEALAKPFELLSNACRTLLSKQRSDGYWWFALEANESIGAEFIFLMHFLGMVDQDISAGICKRIIDVQREDGTWALFYEGPADLSTTIECYFALKLCGYNVNEPMMQKARSFILSRGGLPKARVFTKIHLAMFGLIPWSACPEMPAEAFLLPKWFSLNIYEFSSWARATIVPLLVFMSVKPVVNLPNDFSLDELIIESREDSDWTFRTDKGFFSWENFFLIVDRFLKTYEKRPIKSLRRFAIEKCTIWTRDHINRTEDIYPALAYGALMFKVLGYSNESEEIQKPFFALKRFQQRYATGNLPAMPDELREEPDGSLKLVVSESSREIARGFSEKNTIHQQCCISPVWDTPWAVTALIEAGISSDSPSLLKAARWLIRKQITECRGDWAVKNPDAIPGGWSFEFENDYFPDVDDTIQVLNVLESVNLPYEEKKDAIYRGYKWFLSMQNNDGGWAAFDYNNNLKLVNRIPFSDHGACLDPSSPDITGRALELLGKRGYGRQDKPIARALRYIWKTQETRGCWNARWGINYIYGTWCVLTGLSAINWDLSDERVRLAVGWLLAIQRYDGGFGESPESYNHNKFIPWHRSVPSQTAWGLMALVAAGEADSPAAKRAANWLEQNCNEEYSWDEDEYTGTGFPGHFYIRYHGYRNFFPLLALARYYKART